MTCPLDPRTSSSNLPIPQNPRCSAKLPPMPHAHFAPWPTSTPSPQPLTLTLDLPNPKNHPRCSQSSPPIINSTPWFLRPIPDVARPSIATDTHPLRKAPPSPAATADIPQSSPVSPGLISVSQSYLSLPVLSQSPGLVLSPFRYHSRRRFVSPLESTLVPYQPHFISSNTVLVTLSDRSAQAFLNLNDLTNSTITITNPDTLSQTQTPLSIWSQTPSTPIDLPSNPGSTPIDHIAAYSFTSTNLPYGLLPEPRQARPISLQSDFSGPPRICPDHIPPTIRTSHQCPERFRVFSCQCKGITPA
ncbi:hypothetical protein E4T56_gene16778 [Termitomyces sp. T112]|nr:hypothetical protein E4T56_gene16778 [Termitomyces sp. T112]